MAVVKTADVQQWLEATKMTVDAVDASLEITHRARVFSRLASAYDITTWDSPEDTPALVRSIVSAYIAAWTYDRQYSENDPDGSAYAARLMAWADLILEGIANGLIDLEEVPGQVTIT